MPWSVPARFEKCVFTDATVRCEVCRSMWKLPSEADQVGSSSCAACDADTVITIVEGGPGSVTRGWPFPQT